MGCIISPRVFWLFYKAFKDLGVRGSEYSSPNALVFRNYAILGVEGFSALPKHCLTLCYVFFFGAIVINGVRDAVGRKWASFIPIPMAMAIPFYLGPYFTIDMCLGSLILFVWQKVNRAKADAFGPAVASGLICGDGIWSLPSSILALAVMKLNLTTGIIPSVNVSAGLLGFFFIKTWTKLLEKSGMLRQPFTGQENTVIQTCVVASYGIAISGTIMPIYFHLLFLILVEYITTCTLRLHAYIYHRIQIPY
ncbi:putative metal-nicotianamine transporter YSL7 [Morella rubra]|uniref:Putative metal-nicotianamine transporter YSL7 n=1 Tax=Morella rubra TaxID=262757 RepID=A0A6A1VED5_9ROSI|nr:putative metal-nicotianamine transporter YSL7 [Morella rubra]